MAEVLIPDKNPSEFYTATEFNTMKNVGINDNFSLIQSLQSDKYDASNPNGYETPSELDARDTADRDRANHTGTQEASTISDFDDEVSNNSDVSANTSKVSADGSVTTHNDVTSAGSGDIITGQERLDINGSISVHDDVDLSAVATETEMLMKWDGSNFVQSLRKVYNNLTLQINNTTTPLEVLNVQVNVQRLIPHRIRVSYGWSLDDTGDSFVSEGAFAGSSLNNGLVNLEIHRQEPKDSGGNDGDGRGTSQKHSFSREFYVTPVALGNNNLVISFEASAGGTIAALWDLSVEVEEFFGI